MQESLEELTIKEGLIFNSQGKKIKVAPIGRPKSIIIYVSYRAGLQDIEKEVKKIISERKPKLANGFITSRYSKEPLIVDDLEIAVQYYKYSNLY